MPDEAAGASEHGKHGREQYFIEGEGGFATASARRAADEAPPFRFSRVGPRGKRLDASIRGKVARAMTAGPSGTDRSRRASPTSASSSTTTSPSTRPRWRSGRTSRRPTCSRAGRRRSTSTACTDSVPTTRCPRRSTRPTGRTSRSAPPPGRQRQPPRPGGVRRTTGRHGQPAPAREHPRSAQRREPRRRPAPRRVHQVPQPSGGPVARVRPGRLTGSARRVDSWSCTTNGC